MNNLLKLLGYNNLNASAKGIYDELNARSKGKQTEIIKKKVFYNPNFRNKASELLYQVAQYQALVFGHDNRREVVSFCDSGLRNQLINISKGVAGVINSEKLSDPVNEDDHYKLKENAPTMKQRLIKEKGVRLLDNTPFLFQPSVMTGTAFLVGKKLILTAGHLIKDRNDSSDSIGISFIFNFIYDKYHNININSFQKYYVYKGVKVLERIYNDKEDWALVELEREVSGYQKIAPIHFNFNYRNDKSISAIGHPEGLPMKYTDEAIILGNKGNFFKTSLDTFWGNSGSPVIAQKNGELGIVGIMSSTSGRYLSLSDHCNMYRAHQFYKDGERHMHCQKITKNIEEKINYYNLNNHEQN